MLWINKNVHKGLEKDVEVKNKRLEKLQERVAIKKIAKFLMTNRLKLRPTDEEVSRVWRTNS